MGLKSRESRLEFRVDRRRRQRYAEAAHMAGMTTSAWIRHTCDQAAELAASEPWLRQYAAPTKKEPS